MRRLLRVAVRALLFIGASAYCAASAAQSMVGDQGWSASDREIFWYSTQGSRLIPAKWLLALERPQGEELFVADGLARFGYLPGTRTRRNPLALPIGFAVYEPKHGKPWVGMTCAACHTSEITFNGARTLVEGAPAGADMHAFLVELNDALKKAAETDAAFQRFASRVLGASPGEERRNSLRSELGAFAREFAVFVEESTPQVAKWGPARLDAFGMIFNRLSRVHIGSQEHEKPEAPVSYPFLWGTSWHDITQWNGAIPNGDEAKRLGRNVGQVLGVFGTVQMPVRRGYPSSAHLRNLWSLEDLVSQLRAPVWPEAFGVPDPARVREGEAIYKRTCTRCHAWVGREEQRSSAPANLVPLKVVRTDPVMTDMVAERVALTGRLEGRTRGLPGSGKLGKREPSTEILEHVVFRVVMHPGNWRGRSLLETRPAALFDVQALQADKRGYKARPLNGVWATGPFLHNGSVRTLRQLLLLDPREETFHVGSREFDPHAVGFVNRPGAAGFVLDTRVRGNSNQGHTFAEALSVDEREKLLDFLKMY